MFENIIRNTKHILQKRIKFKASNMLWLVILILTTLLLFIKKLDKAYAYEIQITPKYKESFSSSINQNISSEKIKVKIHSFGFGIINYLLFEKKLDVNLDEVLEQKSGKSFWIPSKHLQMLSKALNKGGYIDSFITDTIFFNNQDIQSKLVPIFAPDLKFYFSKGFMSFEGYKIFPQKVRVFATESELKKINSISLPSKTYYKLNKPIKDSIKISLPKNIIYSRIYPSTVVIQINPEPYTEKTLNININPINIPEGFKAKLFPEKVQVKFKVSFNNFSSITENSFKIEADASNLDSKLNQVPLKIKSYPKKVSDLELEMQEIMITLVPL